MGNSLEHCPCCGRNCSKEMPGCMRGVNFFRMMDERTGENNMEENNMEEENMEEDKKTNHHNNKVDKQVKDYQEGFQKGVHFMEQKELRVEDKIIHQLRGFSHMAHHRGGAKVGQMRIITILDEKGNMSQKQLQDLLEIQPGSLSEILSKIEAAGFIHRNKNEQDKRQIDIELTDQGRKAVENLKQEKSDKKEELFENLSTEEREQLSSLLEKLMDGWKMKENRGHRGPHGHGRGHGHGCGRSQGDPEHEGHGHGCDRGPRGSEHEGHGHGCGRGPRGSEHEGHGHGCGRGQGDSEHEGHGSHDCKRGHGAHGEDGCGSHKDGKGHGEHRHHRKHGQKHRNESNEHVDQ